MSEHNAMQVISEAINAVTQDSLNESWGDLVDRREYLYDTPGFGVGGGPVSILSDRLDGKDTRLFENEHELAITRGIGQFLVAEFPSAINILESLTNYTIGTGYTYEAQAESDDTPLGLADAVQKVVDVFIEDNDFACDLEREIHERSREDGESAVALLPNGWKTQAQIVESAAITEPANTRQLEDWLGLDGYASSWSFGVHSPANDPSRPIGYHVVRDETGRDWDYYPAEDVGIAHRARSGLLEHFKRSRRNVKRGVSEYYQVRKFLNHADGLLENSAHGAKIQAAIAYIVEHSANYTKTQVANHVAGQATSKRVETPQTGPKTYQEQRFRPGKVVHTPNGTVYKPAPMGSSNAPNFIIIEQALLRYAGLRWSMPEYMVSGDASNANYSSTLVAESPFVKSREADQMFYVSRFRRMMWKVIKIAHAAGFFDKFGVTFDQLMRLIRLAVTPPEVATRNKYEDAQTKEIEKRNGVLSAKTWAKETNRDYDEELENGVADESATVAQGSKGHDEPIPGVPTQPTGEFGDLSRMQLKRNRKAINDVLGELQSSDITAARAVEELTMLGIEPGRAERLVADTQDADGPTEPEIAAALESIQTLGEAKDFLAEVYP